ncbi:MULTISPECIES: CBM20 domain-containing protein [Candidatus Protochlamydia]|uniref:CBM20 domain-containing protein n=1 Tax=Candidatus Protochlamydia amoebophila TaxID=362787 RepID=A0A0C1HFA6_9BACT|nr:MULTISPECIES: CBM20 domain-containing protein [Protochlamydia]KIC73388.1 hypothetical protein DB44_BG00770 [Candidatus Protochlamydia amoebophila]
MLTKKDSLKNPAKTKITQSPQPNETDVFALAKAPTQHPAKIYANQKDECEHGCSHFEKKPLFKTSVLVKYDVGFNNQLYIRGNGANLTWNKGQPLKNIKADEWIWENETPFSSCEFKVLINDNHYEAGENHTITNGCSFIYTPSFA